MSSKPESSNGHHEHHKSSNGNEDHQHEAYLSRFLKVIDKVEIFPKNRPAIPPEKLQENILQTLDYLKQLLPLKSKSLNIRIWNMGFNRLWFACTRLRILSPTDYYCQLTAKVGTALADLLVLFLDVVQLDSQVSSTSWVYHQTGRIWYSIRNFRDASYCFERAAYLLGKLHPSNIKGGVSRFLDLNMDRALVSWKLSHRNLAVTFMHTSLFFRVSSRNSKDIDSNCLLFIDNLVSEMSTFDEALMVMKDVLNLCEKEGFGVTRTPQKTSELRLKAFLLVHLNNGGQYENVIACVRSLRDRNGFNNDTGEILTSFPLLAMRAWLRLGKYEEAETELRGMLIDKGVSEDAFVSAVEAYFQAAGASGAEFANGVFLRLLEPCNVTAGLVLRITQKLIDHRSLVMAKGVAKLVSEVRIRALFNIEAVTEDNTTMYILLWDCAYYHRHGDYKTSADMYEKGMLYIPQTEENRSLRAKGYRSMCSYVIDFQVDRAQEYIDEAEKHEQNAESSYLKFKILLRKKDDIATIDYIESIRTCLYFTKKFLQLLSTEIIYCSAFRIAAALSNFYSLEKPMPMTEARFLGRLVSILYDLNRNELEAYKFLKRAKERAFELGPKSFYHEGEEGRSERNVFAGISWSFGKHCWRDRKYALCAEFLTLVTEFAEGEENKTLVCKSLIVIVAAMIASETLENRQLTTTQVEQVIELLEKTSKMLGDNATSIIEPKFLVMHTANAYYICGRMEDSESQQLVLKKIASCNSKEDVIQMGLVAASQGQQPNMEAAIFVLKDCSASLLTSDFALNHWLSYFLSSSLSHDQKTYSAGGVEDDAAWAI